MNQVVMSGLEYLIGIGITALVGFVCTHMFHLIGTARLKKLQTLIDTHLQFAKVAVKYVEQAFGDFGSGTKFDRAVKYLVTLLNQYKIPVSQAQAEQLIEAALKDMKLMWGEEWNKEKKVLNASTPQE